MGLTDLPYEHGQTPLDEDEKDGLRLPSVTTRGELDEVEQRNIEEAIRWTIQVRRRFSPEQVLTESFLLDDSRFWITNKTFRPDEIALRFKHRLVSIHCFANGNGRHSRLMADIIVEKIFNGPVFTWGSSSLSKKNDERSQY